MKTGKGTHVRDKGHNKSNTPWSNAEKSKPNPNSLRFKLPTTFVSAVIDDEAGDMPATNEGEKSSNTPDCNAKRDSPSLPSIESSNSSTGTYQKCTHKSLVKESSVSFGGNVLLSDLPAAVITVAHHLDKAKERRSKRHIAEMIETIMQRVTNAFEHYGIAYTADSDEDVWFNSTPLGGIDIQFEAEKRQERNFVNEVFTTFETRCTSRCDIIKDIDKWITHAKDTLRISEIEEDIDEIIDEHAQNMADINEIFSHAKSGASRLAMLIYRMFHGKNGEQDSYEVRTPGREVVQENMEDISSGGEADIEIQKQKKPFAIKKPLAEKDFLNAPGNAKKAALYISSVLEESARSTTNAQAKAVLKSGIRQFKSFWEFAERKIDAAAILEEKVRKQSADVEKKNLEEQRKKDQEMLKALTDENFVLKGNIGQLQVQITNVVNQLNEEKGLKQVPFIEVSNKASDHESEINDVLISVPPLEIPAQRTQGESEKVLLVAQSQPAATLLSRQASLLSTSHRNNPPGSQMHAGPPQSHHSINLIAPPSFLSVQNTTEADPDLDLSLIKHMGSSNLCCIAGENEAVKALEMQVSLLTERLFEAEDLIADQQRKLEVMQEGQTVELPPLPKYQASSHQAFKKRSSVRGSVDVMGLIIMQRKCDQLENENLAMGQELVNKENELHEQKNLVERLRLEMQQLADDKANLEEKHANDLFKVDRENLTQQQVVMRLKHEFQSELQRLREHLHREQQRFQAELRKSQMEQKKFTLNVNKENLMMMRALNKFKEATVNLLKREDLHDEASEMLMIDTPQIEIYANCQDSATILTALSTSAKDILVAVQSQLSRAMLNKRLAIRDASVAKQNTQRELSESLEKLQRVTVESIFQEQQLSTLAERNAFLAARYKEALQANLFLEKEIEPYKEILEKYQNLKSEMQQLQRESRETARENASRIRELDKERTSLKKSVLEHQSSLRVMKSKAKASRVSQVTQFSKYYISKKDRIRNVDKMTAAMKGCKISGELFEKGVSALHDVSELAQLRLAHLVGAYSAHNTMSKIKAVVSRAGSRAGARELKYRQYLNTMEERFYKKAVQWEEKRDEFIRQREEAFSKLLEVMKAVHHGSALQLEPTKIFSEMDSFSTDPNNAKSSWKDVPSVRKSRRSELPPIVEGKSAVVCQQKRSLWQMPPSVPDKLVQINTPSIVDLDVNPWKKLVNSYKIRNRKAAQLGNLRVPPIATLYP